MSPPDSGVAFTTLMRAPVVNGVTAGPVGTVPRPPREWKPPPSTVSSGASTPAAPLPALPRASTVSDVTAVTRPPGVAVDGLDDTLPPLPPPPASAGSQPPLPPIPPPSEVASDAGTVARSLAATASITTDPSIRANIDMLFEK
ncbi:hypothetical protein HK405_001973, partial [Cladochytrium tenue]